MGRSAARLEFGEWYRSTHPRLIASMLLLCGDVGLAEEACDEAFARAYERWPRVQGMEFPDGWLYTVARNVVRRRARRSARERAAWNHVEVAASLATAEPAFEAWAVVDQLPARQRLAVILRYVGDLTEPEIGRVMHVSRGTVASLLSAARQSLAVSLRPISSSEETDAHP